MSETMTNDTAAERRRWDGDELRREVMRRVIPWVQTPAQYLGGEMNSVTVAGAAADDFTESAELVENSVSGDGSDGRLCLVFPDTYAIGMSCHAMQLLCGLMRRRPGWRCERAYAPWSDMEARMRDAGLPWYSLESFTPLAQFDVLGFTLQSELTYTNVLTVLDLGGVTLSATERSPDEPLVIAGGPCAWNPEPMSRFIDLFVIGDGEEILPMVCDMWIRCRSGAASRHEALRRMAVMAIPGVYVPSCYDADCTAPAPALPPVPHSSDQNNIDEIPSAIHPAIVEDLDAVPLPTCPVVPLVEAVQDRIAIEVMRGCPHRCRFCQSNPIRRPVRYRSIERIVDAALESYRNTGYNEVSLLSLSTSDYPGFPELMRQMQEVFRPLDVAVSVPSLRVNEQLAEAGDLVTTYRRSGLTIAPEAATESLRRRIGKNITDEDLDNGCRRAFEAGFNRVKLYFMCGLPGETESDIEAMIGVAERISRIGKGVSGRFPQVVVSCSNFIPKPHTPLQWATMQTPDYFREARSILRNRNRYRSITVKSHEADGSALEGLLARGDRRMGAWIEAAWRDGARFESWSEIFDPFRWWNRLDECGIDPGRFLHAPPSPGRPLPWDHIELRQGREWLVREYECSLES